MIVAYKSIKKMANSRSLEFRLKTNSIVLYLKTKKKKKNSSIVYFTNFNQTLTVFGKQVCFAFWNFFFHIFNGFNLAPTFLFYRIIRKISWIHIQSNQIEVSLTFYYTHTHTSSYKIIHKEQIQFAISVVVVVVLVVEMVHNVWKRRWSQTTEQDYFDNNNNFLYSIVIVLFVSNFIFICFSSSYFDFAFP